LWLVPFREIRAEQIPEPRRKIPEEICQPGRAAEKSWMIAWNFGGVKNRRFFL
jgi:hypothetical protein